MIENTHTIIFLARGSGKLYFIKRYYIIPELIRALEKIKEVKWNDVVWIID